MSPEGSLHWPSKDSRNNARKIALCSAAWVYGQSRAVPPEVRLGHSWVTVGSQLGHSRVTVGSYVFPAKVASEHQTSTCILGSGLFPGAGAQNPRKTYDPTVTQL